MERLAALINLRFALFLAILVLLVRPLAVALCTLDGRLKGPDRLFPCAGTAWSGGGGRDCGVCFATRRGGICRGRSNSYDHVSGDCGLCSDIWIDRASSCIEVRARGTKSKRVSDNWCPPFCAWTSSGNARGAGLPILVVDTNPGLVRLAGETGLPRVPRECPERSSVPGPGFAGHRQPAGLDRER